MGIILAYGSKEVEKYMRDFDEETLWKAHARKKKKRWDIILRSYVQAACSKVN